MLLNRDIDKKGVVANICNKHKKPSTLSTYPKSVSEEITFKHEQGTRSVKKCQKNNRTRTGVVIAQNAVWSKLTTHEVDKINNAISMAQRCMD